MSASNMPKSILLSPSQEDKSEDLSCTALKSTKLYEITKVSVDQGVQEIHQNRIKSLRKELDFIKETEWKYEPTDIYIGQCSQK